MPTAVSRKPSGIDDIFDASVLAIGAVTHDRKQPNKLSGKLACTEDFLNDESGIPLNNLSSCLQAKANTGLKPATTQCSSAQEPTRSWPPSGSVRAGCFPTTFQPIESCKQPIAKRPTARIPSRSSTQQRAFQGFKRILLGASKHDEKASLSFEQLLRSHEYAKSTINTYKRIFDPLLNPQHLVALRSFLSTSATYDLAVQSFKSLGLPWVRQLYESEKPKPWHKQTTNVFAKIAEVYFFETFGIARKQKRPTIRKQQFAPSLQSLLPANLEQHLIPGTSRLTEPVSTQNARNNGALLMAPPDPFPSTFELSTYHSEEPPAESLFSLEPQCVGLDRLLV